MKRIVLRGGGVAVIVVLVVLLVRGGLAAPTPVPLDPNDAHVDTWRLKREERGGY